MLHFRHIAAVNRRRGCAGERSMNNRLLVAAATLWLASLAWTVPQAAGAKAAQTPQQSVGSVSPSDAGAVVTKYCVSCHNERTKSGGLALDKMDLSNAAEGADVWEKVIRKVRVGM